MSSLSSIISFPSSTANIILRRSPPPAARSVARFFADSNSSTNALQFRPVNCSHATDFELHNYSGQTNESSNFEGSSIEKQASDGNIAKEEQDHTSTSNNSTWDRLKRYGISGVLSYGLLNTAYYLTTFLVVWFYAAPAPGKMGYWAAAERFLKIMAMVWAGSQVTKILRAAGALALAPIVDRGLSWFTIKFGFKSQGKAFAVIAGMCFGLAFLLFFILTVLWA